ncbi:MAG: helicase-related protein [Nitrososphaerota archaeon]
MGKTSILKGFISRAGLLVVDEFDFYGPRSIALLLSMLKLLIRLVNPSLQLTLMTAALQNPAEVAEILTGINSRPTTVVDGRPFHPANYTYLVLGKSLRSAWNRLREYLPLLRERGAGLDVMEAAADYERFRENYYRVSEAAQALGIDIRRGDEEILDILAAYASDDVLSIVFTRSIATAEEMMRRVSMKAGTEANVAAHHHLLLKSKRADLENAARNGVLKLVFSPRTLSQGIDIGSVGRVIHLGLPSSVREFRQREGRKGRRPEMGWTETVIIPVSQWDRDLLSRGVRTLRSWIEMPMEHVMVNPENQYSKLFESLYAFQSPVLRPQIGAGNIRFLETLGLLNGGELSRAGKSTWMKMNFYEFAPPFGIKRRRLRGLDGFSWLEDVSHVDLVEKFQPGCIDYSCDGLVVGHRSAPRRYRVVTEIVVDDLRESVMRHHEALAYVIEEYERTKSLWGEQPNLRSDYMHGKLHSAVQCVVHAPSSGFGLYTKIPNRVEWRLISGRRRVFTVGDRTLVTSESKNIEVPTPTIGIYSDYTYGLSVEADPSDDPELLRLALAYTLILLRRVRNIPLDLIKYDIYVMGERKIVAIHETESAGLIPRIDWSEVERIAAEYVPDGLDEVLLNQVDEIAYSAFISLKLDWSVVKTCAVRLARYFRLQEMIELRLGDLRLSVRKPSRALKTLTVAAEELTLRDDLRTGLYGVACFDGEKTVVSVGLRELGQPEPVNPELLTLLSARLDEGFHIVVYDMNTIYSGLDRAGLRMVDALLRGCETSGKLISLREKLEDVLKETLPLETLEAALGLGRDVGLKDLVIRREMARSRRPSIAFIRTIPWRLAESLGRYLENEVRNVYMAWLVYEAVKG